MQGERPTWPTQVVVGEDADHALPGAGLRGVDAHDPARRVVAAHEGGVEHAVELHVVGVGREAADEARILAALDALADVDRLHGLHCFAPGEARRVLHGVDDVLVAGATAEVALEAVADLFVARIGVALEKLVAAMIMPGVQ